MTGRSLLCACALVVLAPSAALAQSDNGSPFLRSEQPDRSDANAACDKTFPSRLPVRCWIGQQFLVLPEDESLRSYGYVSFFGGTGLVGQPTYEELAGKVVTVTDVQLTNNTAVSTTPIWIVTFKADATGRVYATRPQKQASPMPDDATVDHLGLMRDLETSRERYLGKTYWILTNALPKLGVNGSEAITGVVEYEKFMPVTVTDVLAGYSHDNPVRIVVRNDAGQEGYFDMAASLTNRTPLSLGAVGDRAFAAQLSATDPKLGHKWPANIWAAIENDTVSIGMSEDQARMAWGEPTEIKKNVDAKHALEHWLYDKGREISFENGIVTEIKSETGSLDVPQKTRKSSRH
ncbi:MAG: hypothetical protein ABSD74_18735 [Rhizomicrobium sp.]|jgi:hypothetical protein